MSVYAAKPLNVLPSPTEAYVLAAFNKATRGTAADSSANGNDGTLPAGTPIEPAPGPKSWWKFDEAAGLSAADASGEGNALDLVNFPGDNSQWVAGKIGNALDFDGANDLARELACSVSMQSLGQITVAGWIYANSSGQGGLGRIFHKRNNTDGRPSVLLIDESGGFCKLRLECAWDGSPGQWATTARDVPIGSWVHVAVTYDMGAAANDPIMYVDAVSKAITEAAPPGGAVGADDDDLWVGNRSDGIRTFDGNLDDLRVYNRILTPGEIQDLYDQGNGVPAAAGLSWDRVGITFDGTCCTIDFGDLGNVQQVSMWINPASATEQIIRLVNGSYIHLVAGTVTYVGMTESATYVNRVATTTMAANEWSLLVCQFTQLDASDLRVATDGTNYGAISIKDLRVLDDVWSASRVTWEFQQCVPDDDLVLHVDRGWDLSRYDRTGLVPVGAPVLGHDMEFDGAADYLREPVPNWRSGDSQGTILAWIKLAAIGKQQTIFATSDEASNNYRVKFWVHTANDLRFFVSSGAVTAYIDSVATFVVGRWYRVAIVSDGSQYAMYINGQVATFTISGGANNGDWLADVANRDNVAIGGEYYSSAPVDFFDGKIRDVQVYSAAKSADWILLDYQRTRGA